MPDGDQATQSAQGLLNLIGLGFGALGGAGDQGPKIEYKTDPATGRVTAWTYEEPQRIGALEIPGTGGWKEIDSYFPRDTADGRYSSDLSYQLGLKGLEVDWARLGIQREELGLNRQQLAETTRSNMAMESERRRQRALDAAGTAVQAYLEGTQLADTRRQAAFQEARALLPSLIQPGQRYFAGQEPGGALATAASRFGLPFKPTEVVPKTMQPAELAKPGPVGSDIMNYIQQVQGAGAAA